MVINIFLFINKYDILEQAVVRGVWVRDRILGINMVKYGRYGKMGKYGKMGIIG